MIIKKQQIVLLRILLCTTSHQASFAACQQSQWGVCQGADLSLALLSELVHQGGTGDCFASAGRTLNKAQGRLQHCLHCIHLQATNLSFQHTAVRWSKQ